MSRQSISFTSPNNAWLQSQIKNNEYKSKSEVINDLVRKARSQQNKINYIRNKLVQAEQNGFVSLTQNEILSEIKKELHVGTKL